MIGEMKAAATPGTSEDFGRAMTHGYTLGQIELAARDAIVNYCDEHHLLWRGGVLYPVVEVRDGRLSCTMSVKVRERGKPLIGYTDIVLRVTL